MANESPDDSHFECGCCFTDYPIDESVACGQGHLFCQDCLKNYIQAIVFGGGKSTLACLGPNCDATVSTIDLGFIEPKLLERLLERQQRDMLAMAFGDSKEDNVHQCPSCNFTCLVEANVQVFKCFQCAKESCQYCGVDWEKHKDYGNVCSDVEGEDESKVRLKTEEAMTTALVRKCPKCSALILKQDGCNFMTCQCGAHFCYACRQSLDNSQHLNHACVGVIPDDAQQIEQERLKGERERERLGATGRKRIGGDATNSLFTNNQPVYQQPVHQHPVYQQPNPFQPVNQPPVYQQPIYQQPAHNALQTTQQFSRRQIHISETVRAFLLAKSKQTKN